MRAAQVLGAERVVCLEGEISPPREGEVLVRTHLASICGSDLHVVTHGVSPALVHGGYAGLPPGFPGHEGVGEVVESRHAGFRPGDWVLTLPDPQEACGFADYQTLPGGNCLSIPRDAVMDEILMAQQLGTTIFALRQFSVDVLGKDVMVLGQGSAGMFFSWLLRRAGAARVFVAEGSEKRLLRSREMAQWDQAVGVEHAEALEAVMEATGGQGVDFLVEAVGITETRLQAVAYMKDHGKMLFFGLPDRQDPTPFDFTKFFRKRLTAWATYGAQSEAHLACFRLARDHILRGEISVQGLLSHHFPIGEISQAMHTAQYETASCLKVGVTFP